VAPFCGQQNGTFAGNIRLPERRGCIPLARGIDSTAESRNEGGTLQGSSRGTARALEGFEFRVFSFPFRTCLALGRETKNSKLDTVSQIKGVNRVEVTKALAALQPLYGKDNIEIVTGDGTRVRGVVRSLKTTQALTRPSVKIERPDGEIVNIPFAAITEVIDHNKR
jgi:hypothetical protein